MKKVKIILIIIATISFIGTVYNIVNDLQKRSWHKTDAVITFIATPDGTVFGNYTDYDGNEHFNEALYYDSGFAGHKKDVEAEYGKKVRILYDVESGKVVKYNDLVRNNVIFISLFIVSGLSVMIIRIHTRK